MAGTSAKVGLGINDGDMDLYGISSGKTKNLKIDMIPDWAVLAGAESIDVCGVVTNGSTLGDGNIGGAGESVTVRIVYLALNSMDDAA